MKVYFSTPEWVQTPVFLGEAFPVLLLGTGARNHIQLVPARHAPTSERLLDQKGQTSLFLLEVMVKFMVTLIGLNFHSAKVLGIAISSCMCHFFPH